MDDELYYINFKKGLTVTDLTFVEWEDAVSREVYSRSDLVWEHVIGDYPTRDLYDDGYSVSEAADILMAEMEDA